MNNFDVLAMTKQLGVPTFFLTLLCTNLKINITIKRNFDSKENVEELSYYNVCESVNRNPVFVAWHFQYSVLFFKEIVLDRQLGKISYDLNNVECQIRESPHIHSFL